jgi:hypothetical protein
VSIHLVTVGDINTVEAFRACVLDAYRPLLEQGGFRELGKRPGEFVNEYSVRIGNETTVIEVEGINYGMNAWTKVLRASEADQDRYGLPIGSLLAQRMRSSGGKPGARPQGQAAQIQASARLILEHAKDVLGGDFSALDELARAEQEREAERRAQAPSSKERATLVACAKAGHAFKRGEHNKVVELLGPHLASLSSAQRKRYEIALSRTRGRCT